MEAIKFGNVTIPIVSGVVATTSNNIEEYSESTFCFAITPFGLSLLESPDYDCSYYYEYGHGDSPYSSYGDGLCDHEWCGHGRINYDCNGHINTALEAWDND